MGSSQSLLLLNRPDPLPGLLQSVSTSELSVLPSLPPLCSSLTVARLTSYLQASMPVSTSFWVSFASMCKPRRWLGSPLNTHGKYFLFLLGYLISSAQWS